MCEKVMEKLAKYGEKLDFEKIRAAYELGSSKEVEIIALLSVLLKFTPDEETILVVLLKEAFLRGDLNDEKVKKTFGHGVFEILNTLRKLRSVSEIDNDRVFQVETLRNMFIAMAKDLRVIVIELVDRLCMLKNAEELPDEERKKLAVRYLDLYVPIADRLGIYSIKLEMEDLAFMYIHLAEYQKIVLQLKELRESCQVSIEKIKISLNEFFKNHGVEARVNGRIKSVYSIYRKLKRKGLESVVDLYDIYAMRVILPSKGTDGHEEVDHLYAVLGLLHSEWKPISKRFKDYIAVPKTNGYRSLHTVVLGLAPKDMDQPVEIQIRDEKMHRDAEYGIAAHWLYKTDSTKSQNLESHSKWLKSLELIHEEIKTNGDVLKEVELDVFSDRIFVLTPRGEVKNLPRGSCPIDFAYAVHTDVGHKCVMAKVDGRVVPLSYELQNGEMVEVVTRKGVQPKLQWLSFVQSGFAKTKIKAFFSSLNRDNNVKEGRRLLNNQLERIGQAPLDQGYSILKEYLGKKMSVAERESLIEEVGKGGKMASDVIRKIYPYERAITDKVVEMDVYDVRDHRGVEEKGQQERQILVGGEKGLPVKIANCCSPKFPTSIVGYVTRGTHITIHKISCPMLEGLDYERFVLAQWKGMKLDPKYRVVIKMVVLSRVGLMRDVSSVISALGVEIVDVKIKKLEGGLGENSFSVNLINLDQFDVLLDRLESIDGVLKVSKGDLVKSKAS